MLMTVLARPKKYRYYHSDTKCISNRLSERERKGITIYRTENGITLYDSLVLSNINIYFIVDGAFNVCNIITKR